MNHRDSCDDGVGVLSRPFVVVEGPPSRTGPRLAAALAEANGSGWTVVYGWAAPLGGERLVCTGGLATSDDGRRALLAALGGAGLIVSATADREVVDAFLDDLRRLGHVDHRIAPDVPGR